MSYNYCAKKIENQIQRINLDIKAISDFYFEYLLTKNLFYAYMENTLNDEIRTKSVYISVNNKTNFKKL